MYILAILLAEAKSILNFILKITFKHSFGQWSVVSGQWELLVYARTDQFDTPKNYMQGHTNLLTLENASKGTKLPI